MSVTLDMRIIYSYKKLFQLFVFQSNTTETDIYLFLTNSQLSSLRKHITVVGFACFSSACAVDASQLQPISVGKFV